MNKTAAIEARYRRRLATIRTYAKWPVIGALIAGGALIIGHALGPSIADELGSRAGEGFARGVLRAQVASIRRQLSISGWGEYH